jgi:uncharacterized Zn-finger protein
LGIGAKTNVGYGAMLKSDNASTNHLQYDTVTPSAWPRASIPITTNQNRSGQDSRHSGSRGRQQNTAPTSSNSSVILGVCKVCKEKPTTINPKTGKYHLYCQECFRKTFY